NSPEPDAGPALGIVETSGRSSMVLWSPKMSDMSSSPAGAISVPPTSVSVSTSSSASSGGPSTSPPSSPPPPPPPPPSPSPSPPSSPSSSAGPPKNASFIASSSSGSASGSASGSTGAAASVAELSNASEPGGLDAPGSSCPTGGWPKHRRTARNRSGGVTFS